MDTELITQDNNSIQLQEINQKRLVLTRSSGPKKKPKAKRNKNLNNNKKSLSKL